PPWSCAPTSVRLLGSDEIRMSPTPRRPLTSPALDRRCFLGATAAGLGAALLSGCGDAVKTPVAVATAGDGPEHPDMKFGIIALADCSPIVIAHEKGLFKKYGINSTVSKGANWAAIRDSLSNGDIQ